MHLLIVGKPITADDRAFQIDLHDLIGNTGLKGRVIIRDRPHGDIRSLLQRCTLFLHASDTGLDKAVLEAMACGTLVLSSSPAFRSVLPDLCRTSDGAMAEAAARLLSLSAD